MLFARACCARRARCGGQDRRRLRQRGATRCDAVRRGGWRHSSQSPAGKTRPVPHRPNNKTETESGRAASCRGRRGGRVPGGAGAGQQRAGRGSGGHYRSGTATARGRRGREGGSRASRRRASDGSAGSEDPPNAPRRGGPSAAERPAERRDAPRAQQRHARPSGPDDDRRRGRGEGERRGEQEQQDLSLVRRLHPPARPRVVAPAPPKGSAATPTDAVVVVVRLIHEHQRLPAAPTPAHSAASQLGVCVGGAGGAHAKKRARLSCARLDQSRAGRCQRTPRPGGCSRVLQGSPGFSSVLQHGPRQPHCPSARVLPTMPARPTLATLSHRQPV